MRARNIKPGICENEILGTADPLYTLLFERLWMIADRAGRLEDRPLRIKAQAFPYRDGLNVDPLLGWLADNGFIHRYSVNGKRYIQVLNFAKHQTPHKNEQGSVIPSPEESTSKVVPKHNQGSAKDALIPDSLIPDSGLRIADTPTARAKPTTANLDADWWESFKTVYPNRAGDQGWRGAQRAANARISEGHTPEQFMEGARRYAAFCAAKGDVGTQYVKRAEAFLGPENHFLLPWTPPPSKAQVRQDKNISASLQWLAEEEAKDAAR